jgi:hypothetical protein
MSNEQTAVDWLIDMHFGGIEHVTPYFKKHIEQAKQMEKEQMDKVAGDWWNEGASYMHDGRRKYESFEQYYNETYGGDK